MFPIEPNLNGWSGEAFFAAVRRTRERAMQIDPAGHFKSSCERMMRGESQPLEVQGHYLGGTWFDDHINDAMAYGIGSFSVTPDGINYVPFDTIVRAPKVSTLANAVCAGLQVVPPDVHSVALIHNSATPKA